MNPKIIKQTIQEFRGTLFSYWMLLIFSVLSLCFTISVIDDESFVYNVLLFSVSVFFPALLGQFLALFRFRDLFGCCFSIVICCILAFGIAKIPNLEDFWILLLAFGPFATLSGLWSIRAGRDVLALFMPTVMIIGNIIYTINNSSDEFETWLQGHKWAIWDIANLTTFVIGIILIVSFLFARERHRLLQWSQEFHYKKTIQESSRVHLGQSSLGKILIVVFSGLLALCIAITAPFLWQTVDAEETSSQKSVDCSQFEEPPPECKNMPQKEPSDESTPNQRPPDEGCNSSNTSNEPETEQQEQQDQEQQEQDNSSLAPLLFRLLMLFISLVLLGILFFLSYPPIRRYIKVRHYKKPLYKISSTESVNNYWELIEIALQDMGLQDVAAPSAEHVVLRHDKEIRDFLKTDRFHPRLKKAAMIHDRVRYGLQIDPKDLEEMQNLASDFYDATWRRLQDMQRIQSFYSL